MFNDRIVFLDLETTGGSAGYDRIIEIGLVEIDCGRRVGEWSTLVNPCRSIPQGIRRLTGITAEMVAAAPRFDEVSLELAKRLEGKVLAAHNARFDYGFLRQEFQRVGIRYAAPVLCTVKVSRRLFPQHRRHNLDALIMRHSIFCIDRHRALGDARVLWELAQIWRREIDGDALNVACASLLGKPAVPPALAPDTFDRLPEAHGVYVLYGPGDRALYVGRSANIRSRVIAHFADPHSEKRVRIGSEVTRIDCTETAGALGAYMQEARFIKKLGPLYNRVAHSTELWAWRWRPAEPGAPPELVDARELATDELGELYGAFRSRGRARAALRGLATTYELCPAKLGLEQPVQNATCSSYALQRCRGACIGAESVIRHAMRVVQALSKLRLRAWPYPGRIALRERDSRGERSELHIVDRWCYLGTVSSEAELHELTEAPKQRFDLGTYKMLVRFLKSPPRSCDILRLPSDNHEEPS